MTSCLSTSTGVSRRSGVPSIHAARRFGGVFYGVFRTTGRRARQEHGVGYAGSPSACADLCGCRRRAFPKAVSLLRQRKVRSESQTPFILRVRSHAPRWVRSMATKCERLRISVCVQPAGQVNGAKGWPVGAPRTGMGPSGRRFMLQECGAGRLPTARNGSAWLQRAEAAGAARPRWSDPGAGAPRRRLQAHLERLPERRRRTRTSTPAARSQHPPAR
jgi:hypothetical protein